MVRFSQMPLFPITVMRISALALILCVLPTCAPGMPAQPQPDYLRNLGCRIVSRAAGPASALTPLVDVNLDTLSDDPADYTFGEQIGGNRRLDAAVRHVMIDLPRDRFNVTLTLDGKIHLRLNHVDLDIYVETVIDGGTYILHCFPEFGAGDGDFHESTTSQRGK
jgi:hypothetical protein